MVKDLSTGLGTQLSGRVLALHARRPRLDPQQCTNQELWFQHLR